MKRLELVFNIISIFVDAIMIVVAGSVAYFLRYRVESFLPQYPIQFDLSYGEFFRNIIIAIPFLILILALYGLYKLKSTRGFRDIFLKITAGISTGLMAFVAIFFFDQHIFPSRLIILMSWIFVIIAVALGRYILLVTERIFLSRGIGLHRLVMILGWNKDYQLKKEIATRPELGYKIIKILDGHGDTLSQLQEIQKKEGIDEIIQANHDLDRVTNEKILRFTHDHAITFNYVPDIIEAQKSSISLGDIAGIPIVELKNTPLNGWGRVVKRIFDFVVSGLGIVILSPIFLLVLILIKIDTRGKVLFVQERYGQGRPFPFYKFRTMYQHLSVGKEYGGDQAQKIREELWEENARQGPFLKIKNDPRVTRVGRFLRKTKLDELPQLFNVLKGDMSLVGPRAHVLDEVELYKEKYRRQFTIKPGVTGLAQINQVNMPDLSFEEEIRLNTFYIENWSMGLDFQLLIRTVFVLLHPSKKENNY